MAEQRPAIEIAEENPLPNSRRAGALGSGMTFY
jgi:hypothetical protein